MSKFDELFEFRLARVDEIDKIMEFNSKYWGKKDHILAVNRDFFEYEFKKDDRVGYFLAVEKETNIIAAAEGVYFYSAEHIPGITDMSSGMFLANPECKVPLIGVELMKRKFEILKPRAFVGPGVNMSTSGPLYMRVLHQDVRRMRHFYRLSDRQTYRIAKIKNKAISSNVHDHKVELNRVSSADELYITFNDEAYKERKPYKDRWYVTHRYFEHPVYNYNVYTAGSECVVIGREIEVNEVRILRIVDILGDADKVAFLSAEFKRLIDENDYEYIDLYELGMDDKCLALGGFVERLENDANIIPNYFEPYECRNVEIYAQRLDTSVLCFKADGDQDRPN